MTSSPSSPDNNNQCIDLTADYVEDNQQRHLAAQRRQSDVIPIADDDHISRDNPMNWRRKRPKSTSPDLFDPSQPDIQDIGDDILSPDINLQVHDVQTMDDNFPDNDSLQSQILAQDDDLLDHNIIHSKQYNRNSINHPNAIDITDTQSDDGLINFDDDLNIDTMPMTQVLTRPVQTTRSSPKRRGNRRRMRHGLALRPVLSQEASVLNEASYF